VIDYGHYITKLRSRSGAVHSWWADPRRVVPRRARREVMRLMFSRPGRPQARGGMRDMTSHFGAVGI
jgi:hypothetical protein